MKFATRVGPLKRTLNRTVSSSADALSSGAGLELGFGFAFIIWSYWLTVMNSRTLTGMEGKDAKHFVLRVSNSLLFTDTKTSKLFVNPIFPSCGDLHYITFISSVAQKVYSQTALSSARKTRY